MASPASSKEKMSLTMSPTTAELSPEHHVEQKPDSSTALHRYRSSRKRPSWYTADYVTRAKLPPEHQTVEWKKLHPVEEFHVYHNSRRAPWGLTPCPQTCEPNDLIVKWQENAQPLPSTIGLAKFWTLQIKDSGNYAEWRSEEDVQGLYSTAGNKVVGAHRSDLTFSTLNPRGYAYNPKNDLDTETANDSPSKNQYADSQDINSGATPTHPTRIVSPPKGSGNDFSFMRRAQEETYNDSEPVKGQGYVPINRVHEVEDPDINKPWELPAESGARETFKGRVVRYLSKKSKNDHAKDVYFLWDGDSGRLNIKNSKGGIVSVKFQNMLRTNYSAQGQHFLVLNKNSGDEFLFTTDVNIKTWSRLKRCFYLVADVAPGRQTCSSPMEDNFWTKKVAELEKCLKKNTSAPLPKPAPSQSSFVRTSPTKKPTQAVAQKPPILPTVFDEDSEDEQNSQVPENIKVAKKVSPDKTVFPKKAKKNEKDTPHTQKLPKTQTPNDADTDSPDGLYYGRNVIPVHINDQVVRLRTKEMMKKGKKDKWDIFDGPWRIKRIGTAANQIYSVDLEDWNDKDKKNKMLTTKIELNFPPKGSKSKTKWVALGRLMPVLDTGNTSLANIRAGCLVITALPEWEKLLKDNAGKASTISTASTSTKVQDHETNAVLGLVRLKKDRWVAVCETVSKSLGGDHYEVEKLRAKRLRRFSAEDAIAKDGNLQTEWDDPWVDRYLKNCPQNFSQNIVIVAEFLIKWSGWPSEDDTWELRATANIPPEFIEEYNEVTDPLRDKHPDAELEDPEDLFMEDDRIKPPKKRKAPKSKLKSKGAEKTRIVENPAGKADRVGDAEVELPSTDEEIRIQEKVSLRKAIKDSLEDDEFGSFADMGTFTSSDDDTMGLFVDAD